MNNKYKNGVDLIQSTSNGSINQRQWGQEQIECNQAIGKLMDAQPTNSSLEELRKRAANAVQLATTARNTLESIGLSNSSKVLRETFRKNPFEGLLNMKVTYEMAQKIADAKFAWLQLIPHGHAIAVCAEPNGGKTTIFTQAAADMADDGYKVLYINADASASDIKEYANHANDYGYELLNPDISGHSNEQVVEALKLMASLDEDYSKTILILDTLKKFTDMMAKNKGKAFYSIIRSLTSRGMTVIALAHTNKYAGVDGLPVYEGTGDLRADFDDLIYLIPVRNLDGTMTVSTHINKSRAALSETTFLIDQNRKVSVSEQHIDALSLSINNQNLVADSDAIKFILDNIQPLSKSSTELFEIAKEADAGFSRRYLSGVLTRYASDSSINPLWLSIPAQKNGTRYGVISEEHRQQLTKKHGGV